MHSGSLALVLAFPRAPPDMPQPPPPTIHKPANRAQYRFRSEFLREEPPCDAARSRQPEPAMIDDDQTSGSAPPSATCVISRNRLPAASGSLWNFPLSENRDAVKWRSDLTRTFGGSSRESTTPHYPLQRKRCFPVDGERPNPLRGLYILVPLARPTAGFRCSSAGSTRADLSRSAVALPATATSNANSSESRPDVNAQDLGPNDCENLQN
jgi:hypothetical protein